MSNKEYEKYLVVLNENYRRSSLTRLGNTNVMVKTFSVGL